MRRVPLLVVVVGLALAACSSDATTTTVTSVITAGSTGSAAPPTTTLSPPSAPSAPSAPATTAAAATTAAPAPAPAPAALTPVVLCTRTGLDATELAEDDVVVFGYLNAGTVPAAVPAGAANALAGAPPDDAPLVPTVFAPGRVERAFEAYVAVDGVGPTWTVRGPDGVARTAAASPATPACPDAAAPAAAAADQPDLAYSYRAEPGDSAQPRRVAVMVTVVGLPATSTCPPGLDPLPPVVRTLVGEGSGVDGPVGRTTLTVAGYGITRVSVFVADACAGAGAVTTSWKSGEAYDGLASGRLVCVRTDVDGVALVQEGADRRCIPLPATGGIRLRRPALTQ